MGEAPVTKEQTETYQIKDNHVDQNICIQQHTLDEFTKEPAPHIKEDLFYITDAPSSEDFERVVSLFSIFLTIEDETSQRSDTTVDIRNAS